MRTTSILLLENDLGLAESLTRLFEHYNWLVTRVTSVSAAKEALEARTFSIAIVDRILDDGDGLEFIEYLEAEKHLMMRLCLTSRGEVMDRLKGLKAGADDYLPKPFATQELILRVKNLLAKERRIDSKLLLHDRLSFNPETGELKTPQQRLYLRRRENQILSCLLRHRQTLVTRKMLLTALWPGTEYFPDTATLDVYVRRLRQSLGEYGPMIKTIRGYGYRLT